MAQTAGERAMAAATQLQKIGFVDFTVDLVKGVYEIIVKASMDQLKAYAELVSQVSKDLATYQTDMIGADDSSERIAKVNSYITEVLGLASPAAQDPYTFTKEKEDELKAHFSGILVDDNGKQKSFADLLVIANGNSTMTDAHLKAFVAAKLKAGVKQSQDVLKSILKIGMQKVVVTNGEIMTKLTFSVDASDDYSKTSQELNQKSSAWGISGGISAGTGPLGSLIGGAISGNLSGGYSSRKLNVSVVNEKSSAATNIQIDILGQVRILFRTETFPSIDA